jgi:hypothetical protein
MKTLLTTTMALGLLMALEVSNPVKAAVDAEAVQVQQQGPVDQAAWVVRIGGRPYWHANPYLVAPGWRWHRWGW